MRVHAMRMKFIETNIGLIWAVRLSYIICHNFAINDIREVE